MAIIKIARFWPGAHRASAAGAAAVALEDADGLQAFGSEGAGPGVKGAGGLALAPPPPSPKAPGPQTPPGNYKAPLQWALVVVLSAAVAAASMWAYQRRVAASPALPQLTLETTPPGLDVVIAGTTRGQTPVTLTLEPGTYEVQIGSGATQRTIQATLAPGMSRVERLEMPPASAATLTGALHVQTEPSRLPVLVDGVEKGLSPLTIDALAPGEHEVVVRTAGNPVRRTVDLAANQTFSLLVSAVERPGAAAAGWLTVASPVVLQLREGGKVVGTTAAERVMLPAGTHKLELVNEQLGFRAERRVVISAGQTARLALELPKGKVSINAQPWAEVWIDGQRIGETPIGNFSATIGSHEVVFKHPELGERRATIVVQMEGPARLGMDMRKK